MVATASSLPLQIVAFVTALIVLAGVAVTLANNLKQNKKLTTISLNVNHRLDQALEEIKRLTGEVAALKVQRQDRADSLAAEREARTPPGL